MHDFLQSISFKKFIGENFMFQNLKICLSSILILLIVSCGSTESVTKIPVSTKSIEAEKLLHDALKLNSISKGDKAKKKLLKAIEIDENFGFAYIMLSTFGTNTVAETDKYYEKALSLKNQLNEVEQCMLHKKYLQHQKDHRKMLLLMKTQEY